MPPKDTIRLKKRLVNQANCNGGSLYIPDLNEPAQAAVFGKPWDVFEFIRIGHDNNKGFKLTFDNPVINDNGGLSSTIQEVVGSDTLNIRLPHTPPSSGFYKYSISYPFDANPECIQEYDPVIIIEPKNSMLSIQTATAFAVGIAFAAMTYLIFLRQGPL